MKYQQINDLFPPVDVPDHSAYLFVLLLLGSMVIIGGLLPALYKKAWARRDGRRDRYIRVLQNCDFKAAKQTAYKISYYAPLLAQTHSQKEAVKALTQKLSLYKYSKELPPIPREIKEELHLFLELIEGQHD